MASTFLTDELREIVQEVASLLTERNETISVAETTSGGLISAALLSYPGASAFYRGGLTLYTVESRRAFAGWSEETVANYKGPTVDVVKGLAEHARKTLGSTYAVGESGAAGPAARKGIEVGYVALAVAGEAASVGRERWTKSAEREGNMLAFAVEGLRLVRDVIKGEGGGKL